MLISVRVANEDGEGRMKHRQHRVVLVGTYKGDQLTKWRGWYNYPVGNGECGTENSRAASKKPQCGKDALAAPADRSVSPQIPPDFSQINELWLFQGTKDQKTYRAEFVGIKTREELIEDYGYPGGSCLSRPHGTHYALFKTEFKYRHKLDNPLDCERVIVRTADFAKRSPKIAEQLKSYLESSDRKDPALANRLPSIITKLRPDQLRVCEAAVQMRFWDVSSMEVVAPPVPFPPPVHPKFTFIDLFAGMGGFRLAMQAQGGKCVFSSEWNKYAQKTYEANFGDIPYGDITKEEIKAKIPEYFDVLCAGFPCQPFSIAGVSKKKSLGRETGFKDKTQGTLFFDVADIISRHRPKAFFLENVKNLVSHDKGNTFRVIRETLEELDYSIHYRVMDGQEYVPQHRERIMIVGFDKKVFHGAEHFEFPGTTGARHRLSDILEELPDEKYTLSDKLWNYLRNYAAKHQEKGNGFGFGMASLDGVTRTLSARYYKDGSEILVPQGDGLNPRRLTPHECASLMGYPRNYRLDVVSDVQAYRQCGNSVVVPLITAVAQNIIKTMAI